jgi:phosphoribosyl 1,2-cyclic phosphate phosphodiesterase
MNITFLGTGTSQGVPIINCDCSVCTSVNPKNKRMRCSVMVQDNGKNILIDTSTDLRMQFLAYPFERIDAILYTHAHADHILGLDDLRRFNYIQKEIIPAYGDQNTLKRLKQIFGYAFSEGELQPGVPSISGQTVDAGFEIYGIKVIPVPLLHGNDTVFGYRIGNFAYCTDVNKIPQKSYALLRSLDVLVIGALQHRRHDKHFSVNEALIEAEKIGAKKTYFTHIGHKVDHETDGRNLPDYCEFAYDGLCIEI